MQDMESLLEELPEIQEHEVVQGTVVSVTEGEALVNIPGNKSDVPIPKNELAYPAPESAKDIVKVDDVIDVFVVSKGGENGLVVSKVKADRFAAWKELDGVVESKEILQAQVNQVVKGGLVAIVKGLRGFIPASQIDVHFVKDLTVYVGQVLDVQAIELDVKKQRLVLSHRILLEAERAKKQEELFATLADGQILHGTVKRLVDYGAFIDIGGIDGLAHISDLA